MNKTEQIMICFLLILIAIFFLYASFLFITGKTIFGFDTWCYNNFGKRDSNLINNITCSVTSPNCREECELPNGENIFYYDWIEKK